MDVWRGKGCENLKRRENRRVSLEQISTKQFQQHVAEKVIPHNLLRVAFKQILEDLLQLEDLMGIHANSVAAFGTN